MSTPEGGQTAGDLTLAELKAWWGDRMITTESGAILPRMLAERGQGEDTDRTVDAERDARLKDLYRKMDRHVEAVKEARRTGAPDVLLSEAFALASAWIKIRSELTQ